MVWSIEFDPNVKEEPDKFEWTTARRRILKFLYERVARPDDPQVSGVCSRDRGWECFGVTDWGTIELSAELKTKQWKS